MAIPAPATKTAIVDRVRLSIPSQARSPGSLRIMQLEPKNRNRSTLLATPARKIRVSGDIGLVAEHIIEHSFRTSWVIPLPLVSNVIQQPACARIHGSGKGRVEHGGLQGPMNSDHAPWPRMFVGNVVVDLVDREYALSLILDSLSASDPLAVAAANLDHIHHFADDESWIGRPPAIRWTDQSAGCVAYGV